MLLAAAIVAIIILSYCVILFGSSAFAPKASLIARGAYLAVALGLTALLAFVGCAAAGREAHQVVWFLSEHNHFAITFDSNKVAGVYRVYPWGPAWSLIPLALSAAAGLAMRKYIGKQAAQVSDQAVATP